METVRVAAVAILAVNVLYAVGMFFMGVVGDLLRSVGIHGLASSVLTILACVPYLLRGGSAGSGRGLSGRGRGLTYGGNRYKGLR